MPIPSDTGSSAERPLAGVRVLAIENFVAGPFASMWLADAGAEVVKIERRDGGDFSRALTPTRTDDEGRDRSLAFLRTNRNKKSVTLDLKHAEGKRVFKELAAQADVLIENLRPGVMDELGLGWPVLSALNPRLVYVAISGFGHDDILPSPYTQRPAFDIVGQAMSGLMHRAEREHDRPVYLGFSLADIEAGILGAYGAMLALFQRHVTGKGKMVDISLYDACVALNEVSVAMYSATRKPAKPGVHPVTAPFGTYRASDGDIVIAVVGEPTWERFCIALGRRDLLEDERFKDGISRRRNIEALDANIAPWLSARTREEAVDALTAVGVPASLVNTEADLFDCPHVAARNMILTLNDPAWGPVQVAGNPVKLSGVPEAATGLPPTLGEHTDDVLRQWLGTSDERIAALRGSRVI
ncbi:CaiB/BaiF CoA transferase family protein [Ramlibacter sp.]|uniref:CaiB/BaiF CoA transferase family protein n=1 Tax=Ramlibacter sp. TaxID=1917967 RepID=UPI003D120C03